MPRPKFKLFVGYSEGSPVDPNPLGKMEKQMNDWADSLPDTAKIRRTQLAASYPMFAALVNYED